MQESAGEVFQIGTNRETRIGGLFQLIAELMGSKAIPVTNFAGKGTPGQSLVSIAKSFPQPGCSAYCEGGGSETNKSR
jgi:nucleoside-diphosphate-sugar epimerase